MGDTGKTYFTLVFEGDITKFKGILKTETPFGIPVTCAPGNVLDIIDELDDVDHAANLLRRALDGYLGR